MDPIFQAITVVFFAVFQAFGGVLIGAGMRALIAGTPKAIGPMIAGFVAAGTGTLMSGVFLLTINPWLFYTGLIILALALLGSAFLSRDYLEEIGIGTIIAIGLGAAAAAIGGLVAAKGLKDWQSLAFEDIVFGVLFSGCWLTVGLGFFITGLGSLLRGTGLGLRSAQDGSMELVPSDELDEVKDGTKRKKREKKKSQRMKAEG